MNANSLKKIFIKIQSNPIKYGLLQLLNFLKIRYYVVRMDTNHNCNLRCKMCYFSSREEKRIEEIDPHTFNAIASNLFNKTQVLYLSCYAEPLYSKNFISYLTTAKEFHIPFVSFTTNGMLLNKDNMIKIIELKINEIIFSMTGGQDSTYEYYHQGGSWEKLWQNVSDLFNLKQRFGTSRPNIWINYILTNKSIHEVKLMIPLIKKYKIAGITLRELIYFPNSDQQFFEDNKLSEKNNDDIIAVKQLLKNEGVTLIESLQCTQNKKNKISSRYPCISPFFQFHINPQGMIKFCLYKDWEYDFKINTFDEIKLKPEVKSFYKKLKKIETCDCITACPHYEN